MTAEEIQELQQPLTEIEKAQLTAACQHHLNPKGMMMLRRLMFSVDSASAAATKATAARCVSLSEPVKECDCGRCNILRDLRAVIKQEHGLE